MTTHITSDEGQTTTQELFMSESNIMYSSHEEYEELKSNQWFDVVSAVLSSPVDASEVLEACDALEDSQYFTLDGDEYRVLHDNDLFPTFLEELRDMLEDTFEVPSCIRIDWESTARDVIMSDGYAPHFSGYDGSTHIEIGKYNIFRTN